jgi:hypothetical protein
MFSHSIDRNENPNNILNDAAILIKAALRCLGYNYKNYKNLLIDVSRSGVSPNPNLSIAKDYITVVFYLLSQLDKDIVRSQMPLKLKELEKNFYLNLNENLPTLTPPPPSLTRWGQFFRSISSIFAGKDKQSQAVAQAEKEAKQQIEFFNWIINNTANFFDAKHSFSRISISRYQSSNQIKFQHIKLTAAFYENVIAYSNQVKKKKANDTKDYSLQELKPEDRVRYLVHAIEEDFETYLISGRIWCCCFGAKHASKANNWLQEIMHIQKNKAPAEEKLKEIEKKLREVHKELAAAGSQRLLGYVNKILDNHVMQIKK